MRAAVDFHHVDETHQDIDAKLRNWAAWVKPRPVSWMASPMFRLYRSNAWQYHQPEFRESCDVLDAQFVEKAVCQLPEKHKHAVRWHYVFPVTPTKMCRELGLSHIDLANHVRDARQMLINKLGKTK